MDGKNGLGQEVDKQRGRESENERGREVVKPNDCSVGIIIDDSGGVNY